MFAAAAQTTTHRPKYRAAARTTPGFWQADVSGSAVYENAICNSRANLKWKVPLSTNVILSLLSRHYQMICLYSEQNLYFF